jgi:hypothetical protein
VFLDAVCDIVSGPEAHFFIVILNNDSHFTNLLLLFISFLLRFQPRFLGTPVSFAHRPDMEGFGEHKADRRSAERTSVTVLIPLFAFSLTTHCTP